jgi:hypothetical protein
MNTRRLKLMLQLFFIFFLSSICFILANSSCAVEQIPVPETFPPHPRLFMDQDEIDGLKRWAETEEWAERRIRDFISYNLQDAHKSYQPDGAASRENSNIANKARYMAFAYALSGEEKLARKVAEILLAYADVYSTYPVTGSKGRATDSTLGESPWAINMATAYDLIYNSHTLSDEDKSRIEENLFRPCAEVLRICNHRTKGNWRSWAFAGLGVVGFCIGEKDYIDEALNGYRSTSGELTRYGFAQQVAESILADGIFFERSLGYHFYTLSAYVQLAEAARHSGVNLWNIRITGNEEDAGADAEREWGQTGEKNLKMMFDAPFYYVFPDLTGAAVADSHTFYLSPNMQYELAYRAYKDDKYAWLLNQAEQPRRPRYDIGMMWFSPDVPSGEFDLRRDAKFALNGAHRNACTLFPSAGYAILRESTAEDATCVLMTYGKYGTGHDHPDKLHISLYGRGKIVAPDAGSLGYGNREHLTWANQTVAHNTVTVDEVAQYPQGTRDSIWAADSEEKPSVGHLIFFHTGEHLKAMRADCDNAYEGVILDRTVALMDSMVFDIYRVRSDKGHQYDWVFHIDGKLSDCSLELEKQPGPLSEKRGYAHIVDLQRGLMHDDNCDINYDISDSDSLRLTIIPTSRAEVILGTGLKDKDTRKPLAIVRTKSKNANFVSVMTLGTTQDPEVKVKTMDEMPEGVMGLEIAHQDGSKEYLLSANTSRNFNVSDIQIKGQLALIRLDEKGEIKDTEVVE